MLSFCIQPSCIVYFYCIVSEFEQHENVDINIAYLNITGEKNPSLFDQFERKTFTQAPWAKPSPKVQLNEKGLCPSQVLY